MFGLGEGCALFIFSLMCILAAPLPRSVIEIVLRLKPNLVVLVVASATALVPFLENGKFLYEYRPRNELGGAAYETDPRFLMSQVALLRSMVVIALLFAFFLCSRIAAEMAKAQAACKRMEKNLFAMKKQAQQASAATMKMIDDSAGNAGAREGGNTEKLKKENIVLDEKLVSATKELDVVKAQAKGFEREHDRLLSQIQELEDQLNTSPVEAKKQK